MDMCLLDDEPHSLWMVDLLYVGRYDLLSTRRMRLKVIIIRPIDDWRKSPASSQCWIIVASLLGKAY